MSEAKEGDKVKIYYKGSFEDGEVFDSSEGKDPLEFEIGKKMVIQGFEEAVVGMKIGDKKSVSIPPKEGYGEYRDDMVATLDRTEVPENINPEIGMMLQIHMEENAPPTNVTITDLNEETITLDGNHPLAGKELKFDLTLKSIE